MSSTDTIIKESFNIIDGDIDGLISHNELVYALRFIGVELDNSKLKEEDSTKYSLKDYSKIAKIHLRSSTPKQKLTRILRKLDKCSNGKLSVDSLILLVMAVSDVLSDEDYKSFKKFIDPYKEKYISIEELVNKLLS
ncbi:calmodulin [Plasmodium brasilianum]|uniref:Calmodulin, putative n=2 Tax=Plasmodium (Plasmodium) TaxID=418103 RepID=A0A1A8XAF7_PLAMA|nr:calmodulin, putative [Plasmodium malariae]KAI4835816.1 calmodulin [Plasmodium brasilianum]SBT01622.1 calmodulin, putative [Plasmodium malariae]SCP02754.1 calmodulin, putative [Plasmodium malariae]